jgi:hypothetical protein
MSVVYSRLSKGLAEYGVGQGLALPPDGRALKQWLEDLPRGNMKVTAESLRNALIRSMVVSMDSSARFNQLERVRSTVRDAIIWLERQYAGSPLPLSADRMYCATLAMQLNILLADGYRVACHALCAPDGSIGLLKSGAVSSALQRSIWHYQQTLLQSWQLYRSPPPNIWLGVHRCYQFAASVGMHVKNVEDVQIGRVTRVQDIYIETALLALMNPLAFSRPELEQMKALATGFAPVCQILAKNPAEHAATLPVDADLPVDSFLSDSDAVYLDFSALHSALSHAVESASEISQAAVTLPDKTTQTLSTVLLARVLKAFGLSLARTETRIHAEYAVKTLAGLAAVHYFAAGEVDFDTYLQQISQLNAQGLSLSADWLIGDNSVPQQLTATVLDHSLGGYRLQWASDQALRVRIGEVIAINPGDAKLPADWMLGVIRWLRYEHDGSLMAGLQLLTRRCIAVAIRAGTDGSSSNLQRGLELLPLQPDAPRRFLVSGIPLKSPMTADVFYGHEPFRIQSPRLHNSLNATVSSLVVNMDYNVLTVTA